MNMMRYEPWTLLNEIARELEPRWRSNIHRDDESSTATSSWSPSVDIKEEDERFVIFADIPGVNPQDIDISMENSVLSIKGERKLENREEDGAKFKRVERIYGGFYRRFSLPDIADAENISASGKDGVLEIVIPKRPTAQARKIPITVQ
jgi:HSP20 family protein